MVDTIFTRDSEHNATAERHARLIQKFVRKIPARFLSRGLHFWCRFLGDIESIACIDQNGDAECGPLWVFPIYEARTSFGIFAVPPHHVAEVVIQQLLPVLPLVRRQWHSVDPFAPPSIGVGPIRLQRSPNLCCFFTRVSDIFEGNFTGVVKVDLPAMTRGEINGILPNLDPGGSMQPGPHLSIPTPLVVKMPEFSSLPIVMFEVVPQVACLCIAISFGQYLRGGIRKNEVQKTFDTAVLQQGMGLLLCAADDL
mmetsp:Transcript_56301/g.89243  ORF Transcript_56301/g.89243 Transcript_56301/m.89243 type:complete len:254 (+) Transcript_56301:963-1724(+)